MRLERGVIIRGGGGRIKRESLYEDQGKEGKEISEGLISNQ